MHKNMHVRICGSRGGAIPHGHPARASPWGPEHINAGTLKGRVSRHGSGLTVVVLMIGERPAP